MNFSKPPRHFLLGFALLTICCNCRADVFAAPTPASSLFDDPNMRNAMLQQADAAIMRNPNDSRAFATRAAIHLHTGELNSAIADLSRLVALNPNDAKWFDMKANAEAIKGDLKAAISDEGTAIQLHPTVANYYCNRGTMLLLANRLNEASTDCNKALKIDSRLAPAYENLAEIQYKMRNYKIVIEYCNSAILRAPEFPDAYYYRGLAYDQLGNKPQAADDKAKAKQLGFDGNGTIYKDRYK